MRRENEERAILATITRRTGHTLRRNCVLQDSKEEKLEEISSWKKNSVDSEKCLEVSERGDGGQCDRTLNNNIIVTYN